MDPSDAETHQNEQPGRRPHKKRREQHSDRKKEQHRGEGLGWRDHRRIVEDVSDALAKNWKFKLQVCSVIITVSATVISLITLIVGGRIIDTQTAIAKNQLEGRINGLSNSVDTKLKQVDAQVDEVRSRVEARINKEFEEPQIRLTVQDVAKTAAARIISEEVQPAEAKVNERLTSFETFLDERQSQYQADQAAFRKEIDLLKKRNELTRMADKAISDGSLEEFQRLQKMVNAEHDEGLKSAETAELFRVFSAYSVFAPARALSSAFVASAVNPLKKDESELTADDLLPFLKSEEWMLRARAAIVLQNKPVTFQIAESLVNAMEKETHLEALRFEKGAFGHIPGWEPQKHPGGLDAAEEIRWFKENKDRLQKELPAK